MSNFCPTCLNKEYIFVKNVNEFDYFQCINCEMIYIQNDVMEQVDEGKVLVAYKEEYWQEELRSAHERSYGIALARMAEAFYYSRIPVHKFLDIGTGPGYFLDAVAKYLPNSKEKFYGIEKFPPKEQYYSQSKNYIIGDLCNLEIKFDAGMCIEVAEHLTPKMLKGLIKDLANISNKGALYIFNTGMPEYVLNEDLNYLDPLIRGHIASYSIKSIKILAEELGFSVFPLKGKTWAFVLEYLSQSSSEENIQDRIWSALNHNMNILSDKDMGTVLKVLGLDTSRAYG